MFRWIWGGVRESLTLLPRVATNILSGSASLRLDTVMMGETSDTTKKTDKIRRSLAIVITCPRSSTNSERTCKLDTSDITRSNGTTPVSEWNSTVARILLPGCQDLKRCNVQMLLTGEVKEKS